MNKFYMNGKLIHKASDHNTKRCEVEKWVFLPHSDFERLKANPYQEHEAITAARDLMYEDKNAYHCIMLLDEYGEDGLLIEAEGFDYPRLSMFVPDAKSIFERYQTSESELKLHDMIKDTVEMIAELAHTGKTDFTSADMIDMDEIVSLIKNAIVALMMKEGAYISEIFKTVLDGIDGGEIEAAMTLGLSRMQRFRYIILPQVVLTGTGLYKNQFIVTMQETSVVGYLAIVDLTRASSIISSRTMDSMISLIIITILYFLIGFVAKKLLGLPGKRKHLGGAVE